MSPATTCPDFKRQAGDIARLAKRHPCDLIVDHSDALGFAAQELPRQCLIKMIGVMERPRRNQSAFHSRKGAAIALDQMLKQVARCDRFALRHKVLVEEVRGIAACNRAMRVVDGAVIVMSLSPPIAVPDTIFDRRPRGMQKLKLVQIQLTQQLSEHCRRAFADADAAEF